MPVMLGTQDIEYLIPNTTNLSDAYQDDGQKVGPIVLQNTTANDYSSSESANNHPQATCWEILTLRLGRYARQHIERHGAGSVTDEMLQKEARIILYGEPDDPWHQTAADNPEWLNLFKKAHGIDHSIQLPGRWPCICTQLSHTDLCRRHLATRPLRRPWPRWQRTTRPQLQRSQPRFQRSEPPRQRPHPPPAIRVLPVRQHNHVRTRP